MQPDSVPSTTQRQPFAWRAMTSVLISVSFLILVLSGALLFVSPPGRVANWTNWSILGLRKHDWISLHVWFSTLFLLTALAHVFFNWRPLLSYFKDRLTRRVGLRREWVAALVVCAGVYAGTRASVPPFSSLLALGERVKESWEQPKQRAPIPHAELLTLAELAQKAGVELAVATNRFKAANVTNFAPDTVVKEIAEANRRSAQQLYETLLASAAVRADGKEEGKGHGQGKGRGGGSGGGSGGGPGRKTLQEYCADEGIELKDTLARLQAKGIKATAEQTLREIAVNNGYDRPYALLEVIQAKTTPAH